MSKVSNQEHATKTIVTTTTTTTTATTAIAITDNDK